MVFTQRQKSDSTQRLLWRYLCTGVIFCWSVSATATNLHPHSALLASVKHYLAQAYPGKNYQVSLGSIDSRLRLPYCNKVDVFRPVHSRDIGRTTLGIRCQGNENWQIYLPLTVQKFEYVFSATRDIKRGQVMAASDFKLEKKDISRLHSGFFNADKKPQDMIARRLIRRGQVITPGMLKYQRYVKRGDDITIMAKSQNLVIRVKGMAMMDGRKGQKIRVKNVSSNREFQATVIAPGTVQVTM